MLLLTSMPSPSNLWDVKGSINKEKAAHGLRESDIGSDRGRLGMHARWARSSSGMPVAVVLTSGSWRRDHSRGWTHSS